MIQNNSQKCTWAQQKLNSKGVMVAVISCLKLDVHQVDGGSSGRDEEDLHHGVVQGDKVSDQVQVPRHEYNQEQNLGFSRNTSA